MSVSTEKRSGRRLPALPKKPSSSVARSQAERLWLVGGGTVALLLTVIAYFFFISPQRSETSDVRSQVDDAATQNAVLEQRLAQLREQNKDLARYQAELKAARQALPASSGVSDFVRAVQLLGAQTGTDVTSLTVGSPIAVTPSPLGGTAAAPNAAPSAAASSPAGGSAAGSGGRAGSGGTAGSAAGAGVPAGGAAPTAGVYGLTISAQVSGSPANLTRFLDQLQNVQPRAVLVTSVTETTGAAPTAGGAAASAAGTGATTLAVTMTAFVAPTAAGSSAPTGTGR